MVVGTLKQPLLAVDPEVGTKSSSRVAVKSAAKILEGCTPVLSQLPTTVLGPSECHRAAEKRVASGALPAATVKALSQAIEGGLPAGLVVGLASLLGRYAQSGEVTVGIWRQLAAGARCLPLRLALLQAPPVDAAEQQEEAVVPPAAAFRSASQLAGTVAAVLAGGDARDDLLEGPDLAALDQLLMGEPGDPRMHFEDSCRVLDCGVALGRSAISSGACPALLLLCPRWPPSPGQELPIELHYRHGHFSQSTAERMLRQLCLLLGNLPGRSTVPLCALELFRMGDASSEDAILNGNSGIMTSQVNNMETPMAKKVAEKDECPDREEVRSWADAYSTSCYSPTATGHRWSANRPITDMISEACTLVPNAIAMIDDGDGSTYTYRQLLEAADKVGTALIRAGVKVDDLVPLMAPRCSSMVLGLLGILRAGAGYVPMDLHWPEERLADVLGQCKSKVVLAAEACLALLTTVATRVKVEGRSPAVLCVEPALQEAPVAPLVIPGLTGKNVVYTFFTSGSTGKPKGVMVEHRGLTHRIHWLQHRWPLQVGEGVIQKVAYTFGLSEWEVFWPLASGATLVLAPPGGEKDADYLLQRACGHFAGAKLPITAHVFVPSMLQIMLERYDELEGQALASKVAEDGFVSSWWRSAPARQVLTCGEALSSDLAQRMFARLPHAGLANLYGPTEGEMTLWEVPRGKVLSRVPAGAPVAGSKIGLADLRERRLAACLEPGEIFFGGPFIARGYLGRPDLDAQAFSPDFTDNGQGRLYLTGDLGRWRQCPDGQPEIEILGRRDFQVKLRGFRIELGEIESAIRGAGARAAVCLLRKGAGGAPALVAYYEPGPGATVSEEEARASCKKHLPPYMQPQALVRLEVLPRNTNGKVDRKLLPEPTLPAAAAEQSCVALAETATEHAVAAVWAEVLGAPAKTLPVDSDFQELGGSSLLAGRATALLRKQLKVSSLPGTAIYKHPTVRRLAAVIDELKALQEAEEKAEEAEGVGQELVPALQPAPASLSSTRPLVIIAQVIGIGALNFIFENQAWSPFWWEAWFLYERYGRWVLIAYLPFAVLLDLLLQCTLVVLLKYLVVGRFRPGKCQLWSCQYLRWWFVSHLLNHALEHALPLFADTPLAGWLLRILGADIGPNAVIGVVVVTEPDLLKVGAGATLGKKARFNCSAVLRGHLHLGEIRVGKDSAVGPGAALAQGSVVPAGKAVVPLSTAVGWHGPVGSVALVDAAPGAGEAWWRTQGRLRLWLGLPWILVFQSLIFVPCIFVLEWTWALLKITCGGYAFGVFAIVLAWIYDHPIWITYVGLLALQKRLLVGTLSPEDASNASWEHWAELRHWLHARSVEAHAFVEICNMWNNSEVLSCIYRLLGTKIGRRVQIDTLTLVEHDCVSIGDYAVFGAATIMACDGRAPWVGRSGYEVIRIGQAANVLDHVTLMPGTEVAERAVLGTCSLAPAGSYFPPLAIHSGSVKGRSLYLRDHAAPPALRALEDKAMRELDKPEVWWRFNAILAGLVFVCRPIPEAIWVITYFGVTAIWDPESDSLLTMLMLTPVVFNFAEFIMLMLSIALKWLIMGRYRAGDHPFFSTYHVKWMAMVILGGGISGLMDLLQGTPFKGWYMRMSGAKVGKDCYLAGLAIEYDLLTIGDNVAIGSGCDTTNHTVENMIIKLAPTHICDGAGMLNGSFAMPGSVLEEDTVLLEHTQVLKGETVPRGEVWAGMPAARCRPKAPK